MLKVRGFDIYQGHLSPEAQTSMVDAIRDVLRVAPLYRPDTPMGKPMRVRMSSAGDLGWFSDRSGYRYVDKHPSGVAWPPIPP